MKKDLIQYIAIWCIIALMAINLSVTGIIQRFKRPDLTETQLFILIPANFVWIFK